MIKHMFVFGVLIPTLITVVVFVGFLICWFKFNIRERVMKSQFFIKHFAKQPASASNAVMHDSVVFSREYPGQGHPWDDRDPRSDTSQAMLREKHGSGYAEKGRLSGFDWVKDNGSVCSTDSLQAVPGQSVSLAHRHGSGARVGQPASRSPVPAGEHHHNSDIDADDVIIQGRPADVGLIDDRVPQTFHFPVIGSDSIKYPDGERHMKGIQMTGAAGPEDPDYGHFIPLERIRQEHIAFDGCKPMSVPPAGCQTTEPRLTDSPMASAPTGKPTQKDPAEPSPFLRPASQTDPAEPSPFLRPASQTDPAEPSPFLRPATQTDPAEPGAALVFPAGISPSLIPAV